MSNTYMVQKSRGKNYPSVAMVLLTESMALLSPEPFLDSRVSTNGPKNVRKVSSRGG